MPSLDSGQSEGPSIRHPLTEQKLTSALAEFESVLTSTFPSNWDRTYLDVGFVTSPDTKDVFFLPSFAFKTGTITLPDINDLKQDPGKNILSVGAGPAYFEQFLLKLGVNPNQIMLSDIDSRFLPADLPHTIFDMNGQWPSFDGQQFDLIVFNQAFPTFKVIPPDERKVKLIGILGSATNALSDDGEIRMSGLRLDTSIQDVSVALHGLSISYDAQKQFLRARHAQPK